MESSTLIPTPARKKLAIMQPYFFPYLGYWQLLAAVDTLVLLDDVNYINRGWINRNRIALNGEPTWLTVPLRGASQNKLICDIEIAPDDGWKKRMQRTLSTAYAKAPQSASVLALFEQWLAHADGNLSAALHHSITQVADAIDIKTTIVPSSGIYPKGELKGADRILDICQREGASVYVNPPGGRELYDAEAFRQAGIELMFLQPDLHQNELRTGASDGSVLSILDSLMHNPAEELAEAVKRFALQAA
ncbi:MAG: WbqC family protein [Gammaproteobacteria bacterium]|nr:WbqC family protein [Gammaproteobacteria bacterium]MBU1480855.1 WbqC family protein [Gammaproteobacteria bacterium]